MGIAAALTGFGSLVSAYGTFAAGKQAAAQSRQAAEVGRIQADQIDAGYRDELNSTISNIRAIRSSAGVEAFSPTGVAYEAEQQRRSDRDRKIEVGSKRMQANLDENDARFRKTAANISLLGNVGTTLPKFFGA